jgi:polar amino acid transport system permease protein
MFNISTILQSLPLFAQAAVATISISLVSLFFGFLLGIVVCAMQLSRSRLLRALALVHVHFFRGVPLLVQLLMLYYLLPSIGLNLSSLAAAIIAVSVCESAYLAEILRGGFLGIPPGQLEAANMLGLSRFSMLVRIQVPQALRLTLSSLVSEVIILIKVSSLVSVVGVAELTRTAQNISASTYRPLEVYFTVGVIYLLINSVLAWLGMLGERRLQKAHQI